MSPVKPRSKFYFRIRAMLCPLYWRCPRPRSFSLHFVSAEVLRAEARSTSLPETAAFLQLIRDVSLVAFASVSGGSGTLARPAPEGAGCQFTFDAITGKLLELKSMAWKGF